MSNASAAATADDKKDDKTPTPPRAPEAEHAETSATDTGAPATTAAEFPKSELFSTWQKQKDEEEDGWAALAQRMQEGAKRRKRQ